MSIVSTNKLESPLKLNESKLSGLIQKIKSGLISRLGICTVLFGISAGEITISYIQGIIDTHINEMDSTPNLNLQLKELIDLLKNKKNTENQIKEIEEIFLDIGNHQHNLHNLDHLKNDTNILIFSLRFLFTVIIFLLLYFYGYNNKKKENIEKLNQGLLHLSSLLDSILTTASEGIITINSDGKILRISEGFTRIFGFTAEECIGRDLSIIMEDKRNVDKHLKGIKDFISGNRIRLSGKPVELKGVRKNGESCEFTIGLSLTNIEGETCITGIISDITQKNAIINELRRSNDIIRQLNEKLKDQSDKRLKFLQSLSHNFNTPLNAIVGFLELLNNELQDLILNNSMPDRTKSRILDYIRNIGAGAEGLTQTVRLLISELEIHTIEITEFPINYILQTCISIHDENLKRKNFIVNFSENILNGFNIRSDSEKFKKIIDIILGFIIKKANKNGEIDFKFYCDGEFKLDISCNSLSLSEKQLLILIDPFGPEVDPYTDLNDGVGTEFMICKLFIDSLGGKFIIRSKNGTTTFTIVFP